MTRALTLALLALTLLVSSASPASAHGRGSDTTNFSSQITSRPDIDGLEWRVLNGDEYLQLRNTSAQEVSIPGYTGEPYLRIGPDGVFRNRNSQATYLNEDRFAQTSIPPDIDPDGQPQWEQVSTGSTYAWHDHRIHWMAQTDPPAVAADPSTQQLVNSWTVPLVLDGETFEVTGDLVWVPGGSPLVWLVPPLVLLAIPIALAIRRTRPDREQMRWPELARIAGWITLAIALVNVVHLIDDLWATPVPLSTSAASAVQTAFFIGIAAFGAVRAIAAKDGAFTALGVGVAAIFIGQGLLYFSVLGASQTASVFPGWLTRAIIGTSVAQIVPLGAAVVIGTRQTLPELDDVGDDLAGRGRDMTRRHPVAPALLAVLLCQLLLAAPAGSGEEGIWFPVEVPVDAYADTWGAPRGEGRTHEGTDIMAPQLRRVFAAAAGEIIKAEGEDCAAEEACGSYYLAVAGDDGRGYFYVHLNNDTPGRPDGCDEVGGVDNAFSERLVQELRDRGTLAGVRVERGEHIGYVGSSGNATCGVDQLHFEIWTDHDWGTTGKHNPHPELVAAEQAGRTTPGGSAPPVSEVLRDAGADRIETAVALSREAHGSSEHVLIAPAEGYIGALLAAPLAALDHAPVLLVPRDGPVPTAVVEELERLDAERLTIVGDITDPVAAALADHADDEAVMIRADDPAILSVLVAEALIAAGGSSERAILAPLSADPGRGWPDALMASTLAAYTGQPILLTPTGALPDVVASHLAGVDAVDIIGGTAVISEQVEAQVRDTGATPRRLAGPDRLHTALAVADAILQDVQEASPSLLHVATATNYPDALAAGPAMSALGSVLVLLDDPNHSTVVLDWIRDRADRIDDIHAVGGPAALPDDTVRAAKQQAA